MIRMFPSNSITLQFAVKRPSQWFGFNLQILGLIFLWLISQQTALTTAGSLMTASQANQTESLNMFLYISGSAMRSWLLPGPSFSKISKRHKSSIWDILCYKQNYPPFLNGISFLALNFPLCWNNVRCQCRPPTYPCALQLDVVGFQF